MKKGNRECNNNENNSDQQKYAQMARMSGNDECNSVNFGDILQLTKWILDSGATCHMTPEVQDFIPGSLEDTYKYIEVADIHNIAEKQKLQV